MTWEALDAFAWEAICRWPRFVSMDCVRGGLDYGELTRFFLWDKVGRAIRREADPEGFQLEIELLGWEADMGATSNVPRRTRRPIGPLASIARRAARRLRAQFPAGLRRRNGAPKSENGGAPTVFLPTPSPRVAEAAKELMQVDGISICAPQTKNPIEGVAEVPYPRALPGPALEFAKDLHEAILSGLAKQEAPLLQPDAERLREQIDMQQRQIIAAEAYIREVNPDLILVHADNHPTHQHYVLIARRDGVPALMLQHGLDCEHHYLDEAYASAIAVWGESRKQRYQTDSEYRPDIRITGNPEYDHRLLPEAMDTSGEYWLWVTRPHLPEKCYAPSRSTGEGLAICNALLGVLEETPGQKLVIKPHPYDAAKVYRNAIDEHGLAGRVDIVDTNPWDLFPDASVVITEDSTAGMEAMFLGKIVVHAHLAPTPPTVAFASYSAALPGYSREELCASLARTADLSPKNLAAMLEGQRHFLRDHVGPCDGAAASRLREFALEIL